MTMETETLLAIAMFAERILDEEKDEIRLAIVGSRNFPHLDAVRAVIASLKPVFIIISGGAKGVDSVAIDEARKCGFKTEVYPADWNKHGKAAGPIRNSLLIDKCDGVLAFWDGESRGTKDTIDKASKTKPCLIFGPNKT